MKVLIAKANQDFFTEIDSKLKFIEASANTCIFKVSENRFKKIRQSIRERNINPYSLMSW